MGMGMAIGQAQAQPQPSWTGLVSILIHQAPTTQTMSEMASSPSQPNLVNHYFSS